MEDGHVVRDGQEEQDERERHGGRLGHDQGLSLGQDVGEDAAEEAKDEDRRELGDGDEAQVDGIARQLQDEPALGNTLHPSPDERNELAAEEQAVVAVTKGAPATEADHGGERWTGQAHRELAGWLWSRPSSRSRR